MDGKRMGLLVAGFNYAAVDADEFNAWYDTEHIPERRRVPGFITAERWLGAEDPKVSLAIYDLQSPAVLQSPEYLAIAHDNLSPWSRRMVGRCRRICRFEAEQILPGDAVGPKNAAGLLLGAMNVAAAAEAEFNAWYDTEHIPRLSQVPGCLAARRFRTSSGNQRYVALYHLSDPSIAGSPAWKAAVETPWTLKLRAHISDVLRLVLRRYPDAGRNG
jgi:hypothetical protein